MRRVLLIVAVILPWSLAGAQESASFELGEHVFNAGGHPTAGLTLSSPTFRVSLDSLGEGLHARALSSSSFRLDIGFATAFPPPLEVTGLRFPTTDDMTLRWDREASVGTYNLYRDHLYAVDFTFGQCLQQGITGETTTDPEVPAPGDGYFYLVTAENGIAEEGTKGFQGGGSERRGLRCP